MNSPFVSSRSDAAPAIGARDARRHESLASRDLLREYVEAAESGYRSGRLCFREWAGFMADLVRLHRGPGTVPALRHAG